MGDGNRIAIFNNSAGPKQLAQIKSVQEKVIEVLQNPSIYPSGKSRAPMKDRLNAAFTNESYAIRNKEEAELLNFAKGYDRVEGIEKLKTVKLRFPKNNLALNRTIVEVLRILGEEIKSYQTPKSKDGVAKPGLVLKQQDELQIENTNWQNILKNDEIEKGIGVKFQDRSAKKYFKDTDKQYGQQTGARKYKSYFADRVINRYNQDKIPLTLQILQEIKNKIDEGRRLASQNQRQRTEMPDAGRFLSRRE